MTNQSNFILASTAAIFSMLMIAGAAMAEEFRSPEDITDADRHVMMNGHTEYQNCLRSEIINVPAEVTDARMIADATMHACTGVLEELDAALEQRGYTPDFRNRHVRMTQQRLARDLIQNAMMLSAQRTSD